MADVRTYFTKLANEQQLESSIRINVHILAPSVPVDEWIGQHNRVTTPSVPTAGGAEGWALAFPFRLSCIDDWAKWAERTGGVVSSLLVYWKTAHEATGRLGRKLARR